MWGTFQCHTKLYHTECAFHPPLQMGAFRHNSVIELRVDGKKEILGFWISQKESSSFWVGVPNDLKSRGVRDVLIFSVDGLNGFEEAIRSV
ncbi:MAG: hypothetical protein C4291_11780, partial [Candidatus Dadabacteria bacterium]